MHVRIDLALRTLVPAINLPVCGCDTGQYACLKARESFSGHHPCCCVCDQTCPLILYYLLLESTVSNHRHVNVDGELVMREVVTREPQSHALLSCVEEFC